MAPSENQTHLQSSSDKYATSFTKGSLASPPGKKYAVVTCMDARIDPASAFGIELGDAHVIRNAGGSAEDALRSLIISEQMLGTEEILVIKHTKCGMVTFSNDDGYAICEKSLGPEAVAELKSKKFDFLPFADLNKAVKEDVDFLKSSKLIPSSVTVSGWVYDVTSGKTTEVV